jgi:hypothetical protein
MHDVQELRSFARNCRELAKPQKPAPSARPNHPEPPQPAGHGQADANSGKPR